jgi:hypothetical protein
MTDGGACQIAPLMQGAPGVRDDGIGIFAADQRAPGIAQQFASRWRGRPWRTRPSLRSGRGCVGMTTDCTGGLRQPGHRNSPDYTDEDG